MTTFNWKVSQLERTNDSDKGVVVVHYRVDAVDGEFTSGAYGTLSFTPDPSASGFIAFDDLTESDVIGWVKDEFGAEKVTEIESALQSKIDEQKNPATVAELPWSN
jgi:hypothetical protein